MTTNIQLARKVAQHVQLKTITLKSAHVESAIAPDPPPAKVNITQQHRCSYEEKSLENERSIHVIADFKFVASRADDGENEIVKLDATFVLVYSLPAEATFDSKCAQHFAELNGAYNAWPYWRELVQTATGRVGLGGILVPVYHPVSVEVEEPAKEVKETS